MKQYFTGFFTAVCLTASVFLFMGSQNKNFGDIEADSIIITSDLGTTTILGGGILVENEDGKNVLSVAVGDDGGGFLETFNADGIKTSYLADFLETFNADGIKTSYLGTGKGGGGFLSTNNTDGKKTSYLGTAEGGVGFLGTNNKHGVQVGYFGSGKSNDGIAILYDRYGDIGWSASGKQ